MHKLIDTHAHLDEVDDLASVIGRAQESGLIAIIAVGVDYESNSQALEFAEKYKSFVFPALGCHPQNLAETSEGIEHNLQFIENNIENAVAIGEIGLDYHKRAKQRASKDTQHKVLKDVLNIAMRFEKPVSVHSRYSWKDCLRIVRESQVQKAVFHWYSGPMSVLSELHSAGFFTSATPAVQYGAEHTQAIRETPWENLMLETDTPVVYHRGTDMARPSEPADVANVILETVAKLKGGNLEFVARKTTENALAFFDLSNRGVG
ncbi:MAG: TatD family hydrolase [Chloroflexi bacterium]|jgi:TatD DNase family protein|nr:TatD family hydrolase [Chloroflexota bacterium]